MRIPITEHCYPDKVNLEFFVREILSGLEPFVQNMEDLGNTDDRYIEEWMELFCDWKEILSEK